jgi:hypothetical protein
MSHDDFAVEPIPGLPARLPAGETIVWQGKPDWPVLARRVFHTRKIAVWFALLAIWRAGTIVHDGGTAADIAVSVAVLAILACVAIAIFAAWAWAIRRTTMYTITTRRVVIRAGVALPVTVNVPFAVIDSADLVSIGSSHGDIALILTGKNRVSWTVLWPHVRPWRYKSPQPMLRALPDARHVASLLATTFSQAVPARVTLNDTTPVGGQVPADGRLQPAAG